MCLKSVNEETGEQFFSPSTVEHLQQIILTKNHKGLKFGQINPDGTVSPHYPDLPDGSIYLYTACGGYSCTNAFKTPDGTIKYYNEPTALAKMNFSFK